MALPEIWRGSTLNPFKQVSRLQRSIDRMMDDFVTPLGRFGAQEWPTESYNFVPACDLEETDSNYLMSFDLPGLKKEDIKIELADNLLTVTGERSKEHETKTGGRYQQERYYGSFQRVFTLPHAGDASKVEASYQDGVLRVAVPKVASTKTQTIKITEGSSKKSEKAA